jgi:hypothetical protein
MLLLEPMSSTVRQDVVVEHEYERLPELIVSRLADTRVDHYPPPRDEWRQVPGDPAP